MIVSGFTVKKRFGAEETDALVPGQHSHCVRCRLVNCTQFADNVTACAIVPCDLCGWRCHECKQAEHLLTCPEEKVPCVNKEYGCPHVLKRGKVASHLPVCPASVVCCAEEWSRWPMHAKDKGMKLPLPSSKAYLDCGQLDVGLAMRDQRMLIDALRAPHKLRRTLRNHLTQKYPAAPLTPRYSSFDSDAAASEDTSQTVSDDETDAPWDLSKPHPGLKESIRSRLFKVTRETTESLASALEVATVGLSTSVHGIHESGDNHDISCALCRTSQEKDQGKTVNSNEPSNDTRLNHCRLVQSMERSTSSLDSGDRSARASLSAERSACSSLSPDRVSETSSRSRSTLHDLGGTQLYKLLGYGPEKGQEINLGRMLGVNIGFECINKYVAKPPSMYTFICAQNFRRDEYRWHFKNVHLEIHQGFCGWLEQRCPLAYLGCTFSFQRMEPSQPNRQLYHSPLLESFGLRSTVQPIKTSEKNLSNCNSSSPASSQGNVNAEIRDMLDQPITAAAIDGPSNSNSMSGCDQLHTAHLTNEDATKTQPATSEHSQQDRKLCMRVRPTVYTAVNWDSKVLFQYDVEEDQDDDLENHNVRFGLISLPFEILQHIAKHLDSFSLCNLSLTCHLLRDVCCSLLNDHGIVLLNWHRQKQDDGQGYTWKIASKRWLFSSSFEPIRSWKFTDNHMAIGEHLKVCQYNKDILSHTKPFRVTELPSQPLSKEDSRNKALSWLASHSSSDVNVL